MFLMAVGLLVGTSAWAYSSQRVYQDWGRGDNANSPALSWTTLSGNKGLESASSSETVWNGTSSNYVHTIYNSSAYCSLESVLPTLTYSDSYNVEFFFKAKAKGAFQYAVYKKGVTPTSTMLSADQVIFSIECTSAASTSSDSDPMTPSINRSATTVNITGQTYYKVVLTVNSTNCTYNIYPINTSGSTPYTVDTSNPVATGTLATGEMGGLYLNANNSAQTMRFDDIMVDFMPNSKTVKTITTSFSGMNSSASKYYQKLAISATDYNDATIAAADLTISQAADTYSDLSDQTLSFKALGTTTLTVNNKTQDVTATTAYIKAASFDFTNRDNLVTDNGHELRTNNASLTGFGTTSIARLCWQRYSGSWGNSQVAKWICNGFKSTAASNNYWQFYSGYGVNVTYNETMTAQGSAAVEGMYTCLTYKLNESTAASGDGSTVYGSAVTKYSWASGSTTATLFSRDNYNNVNGAGAYIGAIYTALDVYVPDATTVTPTINTTYGVSTFSYPYALDLSGLTTMDAWTATTATNSTITLAKQTGIVPAGTPLILTGTAEVIPLADISNASSVGTNYLKPVLDNDASKTVAAATDGSTNYVLSVQGGVVVFAPIGATSASVPYGNAYMNATPVGEARSLNIVFGDETTGVNEELRMKNEEFETVKDWYNLAGQRVAQPTRGLYIVNGKKVIIK